MLGTLAAALVIFLVGVVSGLIGDVSLRVWLTVLGAAALLSAAIVAFIRRRSAQQAGLERAAMETMGELSDAERDLVLRAIAKSYGGPLDADETRRMADALVAATERAEAKRKVK